jgi:DNA-binding CsgD family transcriptional regulator
VTSRRVGYGDGPVLRPFVGRADALAQLASALREASGGRPVVVAIEGLGGVGKTALVRQILATIEGLRVVTAWGAEAESFERFGVAGQLLRGLAQASGDASVDTATGLGEEVTAVGGKLLAALGAEPKPAVLVVDDAQWADGASLQALGFALRRFESDAVLTVICTRSLEGNGEVLGRLIEANRGRVIHLGGLSTSEVRQLAEAFGVSLSMTAARRLQSHTDGLPLHVTSLLRDLDASVLADARGPLPAPRSYATLVLGSLARCSQETGELVSAAAVLGSRCLLSVAAAVASVENPVGALDEAVSARLLEYRRDSTSDHIRFVHELVRAAVLDGLAPSRRLELHSRAAACLDGVEALDHRAAALVAPDAGVATDLAATAAEEATTGSIEAAVHHFMEAARISADPAWARTWRMDALEALVLGGATAEARGLAGVLEAELVNDPDRARVDYLYGHVALLDGRPNDAERLLRQAWDECDRSTRPRLAALVAAQLSLLYAIGGRNRDAADWSARVTEYAGDNAPLATAAVATLLSSLVLSGRPDEALALALPEQATAQALQAARFHDVAGRALVRLWTDDLSGARSDLAAVTNAKHRRCPLRVRLFCMGYLAEVEYRAGHWLESAEVSTVAASLAEDAGQVWLLGLLHGIAAFSLAGRGMWAAAETHVRMAQAAGAMIGDVISVAYPAVAATVLAAAQGDHAGVLAATDVLVAMVPQGSLEPAVHIWCPQRIEAFVAQDRPDHAAPLLVEAEELARARGRRSALVGLARARGTLAASRGNPTAATAAFEYGAALLPGLGMPFETGLLRLAYGTHLRRGGQRRAAVDQLQQAHDAFMALEAAPYLERVQAEMAACGLTPRRRGPGRPVLTDREQAVARLVAEGLTNREIAQRMVVSPKTVEYHLGNAFMKLGVRSRAHLAARLATPDPLPPED